MKDNLPGELLETVLLPAPIDSPFSGRHQALPQTCLRRTFPRAIGPRVWTDTPYPLKLPLLHPISLFFPNVILYRTG